MGIKKGMKLTDTPKDRTIKFRYDADTEAKLNAVCEVTGKTKAQVIREGIDRLYDEIRKTDMGAKLNAVCEATGKTKAQVICDGIDKLYAEIRK